MVPMATHTQQCSARPKPWQHGTRPVNNGYKRDAYGPTRCSLTGVHYASYMELHLLAKQLSKGMGKHVSLAQALHHAVASALRDLDS